LVEKKNIIHRDIKIENILVKKKEGSFMSGDIRGYTFKIGDMGLAKQLQTLN
jgi:serine/threonine protein kinase